MNHLSQEGGVPWDAEEINVQHNSRPTIQLSEGSDEPLKVYHTHTHARGDTNCEHVPTHLQERAKACVKTPFPKEAFRALGAHQWIRTAPAGETTL